MRLPVTENKLIRWSNLDGRFELVTRHTGLAPSHMVGWLVCCNVAGLASRLGPHLYGDFIATVSKKEALTMVFTCIDRMTCYLRNEACNNFYSSFDDWKMLQEALELYVKINPAPK